MCRVTLECTSLLRLTVYAAKVNGGLLYSYYTKCRILCEFKSDINKVQTVEVP